MEFIKIHLFKVVLIGLLCFLSVISKAQDAPFDKEIIYESQLRFSLAALVYDNLKLTYEGKKHLKSAPTVSGGFTISYYKHIWNGYGVILGAGYTFVPSNTNYDFEAPDNSIFRTNGFYDYKYLFDSNYEYEGMFLAPLSIEKLIQTNQKYYVIEIGVKLNILNQDPNYLPARLNYGGSTVISENGEAIREFDSYTDITDGITTISYFTKIGLVKILKKQRLLEYKVVANWSPKYIRKGRYEFSNLGYESKGNIKQNINYIGFEVSYGFTLSRRLKTKNEKAHNTR